MKLRNQVLWNETKAANENGEITTYAGSAVYFAEHWANCMENGIEHGRRLEDIADDCEAEVDGMMGRYGVTGFQYGWAVGLLAQVWEYGDQLRIWHNAKYGVESETGTVNPAIMTIG